MGLGSSRSVEIEVINNTQNITLKNPRTYFGLGCCSKRPRPELSPGSRGTCSFWGHPKLWSMAGTTGVSGILVYEAKSFSLAIYFSNPTNYNYFSMKLGLELSPGKAHLGELETTYRRMAGGIYSSSDQDIKFARIIVSRNHGTVQVSHGPVQVMATMTYDTSSTLRVVLEEQRGSVEEAKGEKLCAVEGYRSKRSEILWGLIRKIMGHPGNSWMA